MKGKRAPLMPREHGAYAMLTFPALTALFLGEVRSAPLLLVAATVRPSSPTNRSRSLQGVAADESRANMERRPAGVLYCWECWRAR